MKRDDIIYPELSYKIVGILYDVYNEIGAGHREKYYQNAISQAFKNNNIEFKEQVYFPLKYKEKIVGKCFFDFLIDNKMVLEIKKGSIFPKQNIDQLYEYLRLSKLKLGIIANFTRNGVYTKRIVNIR